MADKNVRKGYLSYIKRLVSYVKGARSYLILSVIFAAISALISILIPFWAGRAIDMIGKGDKERLIRYLLMLLVAITLASLMQFALNKVNNSISYHSICRLRNDAYGKIRKLPISYLDKTSAGMLQSMIISDCETVGDGFLLFLNHFISGIVTIIFTLIMMFYIEWRIALTVLLCSPLSFAFAYFIAKSSFNSFKRQSEIRSRQTSFISEMTSDYVSLNIYGAADRICTDFDVINDEYRKTSSLATYLSSMTNPGTRLVNNLIYAAVALIGSLRTIGSAMTVGSLTAVLSYANRFTKPFNDLSSVYTEMSDSFACLSRIFAFLDEKEINDDLSEKNIKELWDPKGDFELEFVNVSFSYVPGKPVLNDISFRVPSGSSCAIVGPTGCGKTTLINLLLRFYEPDSGQILVNGVDISSVPRNVLRHYIGTVAQDTWFSNGSVMENIKYGNPDLDDSDAQRTAHSSGADSFIRKLPDKYDSIINASREELSEGQRQLLSITRAMASDPSILILDEATSSVDILTEVKIQRAVRELLDDRTSIIIAHRLSTIIDADMIVVLENGRLSDIGTHEQLLVRGGFYSRLYKSYTA